MSLFGDDDEASGRTAALFKDTAGKSADRGLFGDDADPWSRSIHIPLARH